MSDRDNEDFLQQVRQQRDKSENKLDATTRSRLTQIRNVALESATQPKAKWLWPVPAMALSSAAIVAVHVNNKINSKRFMADFESMSDDSNLSCLSRIPKQE